MQRKNTKLTTLNRNPQFQQDPIVKVEVALPGNIADEFARVT